MGQEITLPEHIKVIIWDGFWTRQDAIDNPDKLFLFGGNIMDDHWAQKKHVPMQTQAVIRDLPNSLAIMTKRSRGKGEQCYFNDNEDLNLFKGHLLLTLDKLDLHLNKIFTVVLPSKENGIGTGTAYLKEKAPKCWELLQEFLAPLYERAEKNKN